MWVFGYGSLIWNPGFAHDAREIARLDGYARSFCMRSIHHRGTPEDPGLVLALDAEPSAFCDGVAFRVAKGQEDATLAYLRERELISSAYLEREITVETASLGTLDALAYVIDADHTQYCGGLPLEEQAQIIARSHGGRGPNWEYLYNTADHLTEIGLQDRDLMWLRARVSEILSL